MIGVYGVGFWGSVPIVFLVTGKLSNYHLPGVWGVRFRLKAWVYRNCIKIHVWALGKYGCMLRWMEEVLHHLGSLTYCSSWGLRYIEWCKTSSVPKL